MLKTFNFGILFGIAAAPAMLWFAPAVDQHREPSLVSVQANGGNRETFHVNLPQDRIMAASDAAGEPVPANLEWPATALLAGVQAEIFKLRDANDIVVGVASRISGPAPAGRPVIEWTLHLPARGSLYASLEPAAREDGYRGGVLRAGTREFAKLEGSVRERFYAGHAGADEDGRIELTTTLVTVAEPEQ